MKLSDFVCLDATIHKLAACTRDDVIAELVGALQNAGKISKAQSKKITTAVIERENEASTGIGKGVAVPHAKCRGVDEVIAAVGSSDRGVDFSSLDKQPVYSVILLVSPPTNAEGHLQAMEAIFRNLQNDDFRKFLRQATSSEAINEVIRDAE